MVNYRRNQQPGGCYFFTVTLHDRNSKILMRHINLLRIAMQKVKQENPYNTKAIVILPEHLHAIWQLPANDKNYSLRWRKIKSYFTKLLKLQEVNLKKNPRGEHNLWQPRFWEHTIRDERDYAEHVNYIHYNPVKHGWVKDVFSWPYSSFHHYVKIGELPRDWGGGGISKGRQGFGE